MYDIVIIGSGPAGLTAAIYALRANKTVIVIEKGGFGGQMTFSPKIENYPGKITISGNELADKFVEQAISLGCVFESGEVVKIKLNSDTKTVVTDDNSFDCKSVIIAAGAKHRQLGVANENHFAGNGISYCAVCDGAFFEGKTVAIVGGGNSALQEAVLLSEICKEVIIIQNLPFLTGEKKLCDSLAQKSNVSYLYEKTVTGFLGTDELCGVALKDESTGEILQLSIDGLFVAIGLVPENQAFSNVATLDKNGYIVSDESCATDTAGIFVAGDCRTKNVRQITTAVSDGAVAAISAVKYIG